MKKALVTLILIFSISTLFCQTTDLSIEKTGNGNQAIILISGLACKNDIWTTTIDSLPTDATIYTIDYYNDPSHQLNTIHDITNQILDWISVEKVFDPIIIGHSLGGAIALNVASKLKGNIKKLIIIDSYPAISALSNPGFVSNSNNNCSPFVEKFSSMTSEQFKTFQTGNYSQMTINDTERIKLLEWIMKYNRDNYARLLCDYLNVDLRKNLESIHCPTLILGSMTMAALKDNISSQYEILETHKILFSNKGLHFLMIDDFYWYIREIRNFIE